MDFSKKNIENGQTRVMATICMLLSILTILPGALAQTQQCVSLATSTTCAAFNGSSISTDDFMVGLYPFLHGVSDAASFDKNLTAYVQNGYVNLKYKTLFGCSGITLDNTTNLYARFTTTVICNGVIQNSISRCGLAASNSQPVCAGTCAEYALSEQRIVADSNLCSDPSNYTDTQLRADYTNCGLPQNALTGSACIEGILNEPTNCGFGYATIGLCQYCSAGGENPTDPCCSKAQASVRCANVVLPSISVSTTAFLTATGVSTQVSSSSTASPSSSSAGAVGRASDSGGHLSSGAIAGIVVGSVAGLVLLLALFVILICVRRRHSHKSAQNVSQREKMPPATPTMVYNPRYSRGSYFGKSSSEFEILPGGRSARKSALPAKYGVSQFEAALPSGTLEHDDNFATSSRRQPTNFSDDFPGGFFPNPKGTASVADSDYVVLPGGRRLRMSNSVTSNSRPGSAALEEHASALPPNGSPLSKTDDYEILPGGRVARKSGLTGHVGGFTVLNDFRDKGKGSKDAPIKLPASAPPPATVITDNDISNSEAAPISVEGGTTMPSNSSIKDYYSSSTIQPGDRVRVVWSYAAQTHDEFGLERGDVLQVTSIWGDGWAIGYLVEQPTGVSTEQTTADTTPSQESTTTEKIVGNTEVKAFPLVCVCASACWDKVVEAGGKPLPPATLDIS